jgi:uncharacterized YccA/Bax inhibitor family protein
VDEMTKSNFELSQWLDVIIIALALLGVIFYKGVSSEIMINLILLFMTAFAVEKYYIGRLGTLPNILIVYFVLQNEWPLLPQALQYYIYLGLFIGVISFGMGLKKISMPTSIYKLTLYYMD